MSDFFLSVLKGLYPVYFVFLILGIICRIRQRQWDRRDSGLLAALVFFEFLAAFQTFFFYGVLTTSRRYLWAGLPLGLPFAAEGLRWLFQHAGRKKLPAAVLAAALIGINFYNVYSPIFHERHSGRKKTAHRISRESAEWIRKDWQGTAATPIAVFKCDQYQSGKRPLVQSERMCIGWLCGGQNYPAFFASRNIMPDYIVSITRMEHPDYIPVKEIPPAVIYKNQSGNSRKSHPLRTFTSGRKPLE